MACVARQSTRPEAIAVEVHDGCATLSGDVSAAEVRKVLESVSAVAGVRAVENRLQVRAPSATLLEAPRTSHQHRAATLATPLGVIGGAIAAWLAIETGRRWTVR